MQLFLQGKNFVISDRVRAYVEKKIGKLDRYLPDIEEARVEITQEKTKSAKDRNIVQVTLRANGTILRAEERSDAIYNCIDAVANKIHRQIARYKGKRVDRWHGQLSNKRTVLEEIPNVSQEVLESLAEENERQIVRVKRFRVNPMNQEEAVEQMELLGHNFYVFYNADSGRINVVYRRADNNYGLLDPEVD
ncbi:MAG: ribosome-associated translation inhibitor RaiA [Anaerolineae bacterium]|nr:ribosome-associated translation inhibitor RaiA [Anaerolineae bacterium]